MIRLPMEVNATCTDCIVAPGILVSRCHPCSLDYGVLTSRGNSHSGRDFMVVSGHAEVAAAAELSLMVGTHINTAAMTG